MIRNSYNHLENRSRMYLTDVDWHWRGYQLRRVKEHCKRTCFY